jgi:hypothetical protein
MQDAKVEHADVLMGNTTDEVTNWRSDGRTNNECRSISKSFVEAGTAGYNSVFF